MRSEFKFEGGRQLERALGDLPRSTAKGVTRRVLKKAAKPIRDDAAANAPSLSGALSEDVKIGSRLTRRQAGMNRRMGKSEVEVHVGVSDAAGVQTEFGNEHQSAQPWLRPAWDGNVTSALAFISGDLWIEVAKSAKRLARKTARLARK